MSNDLMVRQGMNLTFEEMTRAAKAMANSGYFDDAKDVSKAMVKVLAGSEIGLGPFAAMSGIHVIKGKPVLGANLIATLVKNDPRYDYQVGEISDDACEIHFFEHDEFVGESRFTLDDAKAAGLLNNPTWKKYPRNMLFARALSNGARWYTPGVFGGAAVYTPDEMDADLDEDGYIIDVTPEQPTEEPQPAPEPEAPEQNGDGNGGDPEPENIAVAREQGVKMARAKSGGVIVGVLKATMRYQHEKVAKAAVAKVGKALGFDGIPGGIEDGDADDRELLYTATVSYADLQDADMSDDEALEMVVDKYSKKVAL